MGCANSRDDPRTRKREKPYDPENESDTDFSDAEEYEQIEHRVLEKLAPEKEMCADDIEDWKRRWWGLGNEKWMECIDGAKWSYGRFCFDLCLHGLNSNRKEIGYLSSIYDAWGVAEENMGKRFTPEMWLAIQAATMSHPGNDFLVGKFRHLGQGNRALVSKFFNGFPQGTNETAFKEFNKMPKKLCYISKYTGNDHRFKYERSMPGNKRHRIQHYLQRFLNELYLDLENKCEMGNAEQIIPVLSVFMQKVCRMEPCRDGNTRCLVVCINKIATDFGLHPMLFDWPDAAATVSAVEWEKTMFEALKMFDKKVEELPEDANPGVRPPRENFVPEEANEVWVKNQKNAFFTN